MGTNFCFANENNLKIYDEYGKEFSWDEYFERVYSRSAQKREPVRWVYESDKRFNETEKVAIKRFGIIRGYKLDGRIRFQGERFLDIGIIYVKDNAVRKIYGLDDVTDDEIIIALTMDEEGNTKMEILT